MTSTIRWRSQRALAKWVWAAMLAIAPFRARATETVPTSALGILQELRSFATVATILHIGAHPDDENTALIAYFARGRGYRTAYLSLTRGDGGQNEIGPEFDEKLGVARTQELQAARRIDGGRQFFTRAIDFGFSKSSDETLRFWDREQVLGDVVRIIREYRPDVIVTRFPIPPGSGGHGHHTASGILGVEAFKLAGDPMAYPEQMSQGLKPWQAKRVAWNGGGPRGGAALKGATVTVDIGGEDPVTGESFATIAGRSRAMHITQGFGGFGGRGGGGPNRQTFMVLGGELAENDLMDGVDTSWGRVQGGGAEIAVLTAQAIADFNQDNPAASVPASLNIRARLASLPTDPMVSDKRLQLDRILQACLGLSVETSAKQAEVVPGEQFPVRLAVTSKAAVPVRWVKTQGGSLQGTVVSRELRSGQTDTAELVLTVPADAPVTQPYWLCEDGTSGMFRVDDPKLIGQPENPPAFPMDYVFEVGGQTLVVHDEPVFVENISGQQRRRRVDIIPPVSLRFSSEVSLFNPDATRPVKVEVIAARPGQSGSLRIETPAGWTVAPSERLFALGRAGDTVNLSFNVKAPAQEASARLKASVTVGSRVFSHQRIEINYSHLPFILLQPAARARVVCTRFTVRGKKVGYLPGAGDSTDAALTELGYEVIRLASSDLTSNKLQALDAVVIGVRAFNERKDLAASLTNLWSFVANGGTVISQYNRPNGLRAQPLGPYPISIEGPAPQLRVTDEHAPVTLLAPSHPVLTAPNQIVPGDFEGWVQERGAYFPSSWDHERYQTILSMSDAGEEPLQSGLLVAQSGKGYYVYTGLAFFRQLPAGVPGAYRLFANLVSLGK